MLFFFVFAPRAPVDIVNRYELQRTVHTAVCSTHLFTNANHNFTPHSCLTVRIPSARSTLSCVSVCFPQHPHNSTLRRASLRLMRRAIPRQSLALNLTFRSDPGHIPDPWSGLFGPKRIITSCRDRSGLWIPAGHHPDNRWSMLCSCRRYVLYTGCPSSLLVSSSLHECCFFFVFAPRVQRTGIMSIREITTSLCCAQTST